ncbi:MAG: acetyl-CoA carboxylase carboxyl transferase subunit alpha, partial [Aestuariivita sp.]|nr:acetyl-CoA carboxylase carboxyl transferase subunit alpha [Aestuariivita sp.]
TAQDLASLDIIDQIIDEPLGGAHRNQDQTIANVGDAIANMLEQLADVDPETIVSQRRQKFLEMGKQRLVY